MEKKEIITENNKLLYPNEPNRFNGSDIEAFVVWCVEQGASDITIQNEEQVFCEIHGKMVRVTKRKLSRAELTGIITAIYKGDGAVSKLNGGEDVDLPWNIRINRDSTIRFRVNFTAIFTEGHKGFQITIRTIKNRAPLLEDLKLPKDIVNNLSPKQGLIIIVGATGSGKSTLLASVMDWRMRDPDAHLKILTYEAPIEYVYDDVPKPSTSIAQTEIGTHLPTFVSGVRNALRRKPSIILMGEMRDKETMGEGVTASMTGHLVYGTLHSNGVAEAVRRMVNVFAPEERNSRAIDILTSLKMIIAQTLLPSTDGKRIAIREYLVFTEEIVDSLLEKGIDNLTYETRKVLMSKGRTFLQDAQEKFDDGLITEKTLNEIKKLTKGAVKDIEDSTVNLEDVKKEKTLNEIEKLTNGVVKDIEDSTVNLKDVKQEEKLNEIEKLTKGAVKDIEDRNVNLKDVKQEEKLNEIEKLIKRAVKDIEDRNVNLKDVKKEKTEKKDKKDWDNL